MKINKQTQVMIQPVHETPWGGWQVLVEEDDYKIKRILVNPGHRLSYQRHHHREEYWTIVAGNGHVVLNDTKIPVEPGQMLHIPKEAAHRMANTGSTVLIFVEVQKGTYFGEDDILRLEDDYGRAEPKSTN